MSRGRMPTPKMPTPDFIGFWRAEWQNAENETLAAWGRLSVPGAAECQFLPFGILAPCHSGSYNSNKQMQFLRA
jgi:hypothetical protein